MDLAEFRQDDLCRDRCAGCLSNSFSRRVMLRWIGLQSWSANFRTKECGRHISINARSQLEINLCAVWHPFPLSSTLHIAQTKPVNNLWKPGVTHKPTNKRASRKTKPSCLAEAKTTTKTIPPIPNEAQKNRQSFLSIKQTKGFMSRILRQQTLNRWWGMQT